MTIGRRDIVLAIPVGTSAIEGVLRVCRQHWPSGVFQDADSSETHALTDRWVWTHGVQIVEFFVFKDQHTAETWDQTGPTVENCNGFLHFIIENGTESQLTIVYDEPSPWIDLLTKEIRSTLLEMASVNDVGSTNGTSIPGQGLDASEYCSIPPK